MTERYVSCMILSHGEFLSVNGNGVVELIDITTPIDFMIGSFAVPTESCHYPPDYFRKMKDKMIDFSRNPNITDDNIGYTFQHMIGQSQEDSFSMRYRENDWAGYFHSKPFLSENWIYGNKYFEKNYTDCPEFKNEHTCGIYVLKNNVGIEIGQHIDYPSSGNFTFSELVNFFVHNFNINKLYIFDGSCGVVADPNDEYNYVKDPRTLNRLRRQISSLFAFRGGKKKKRRNQNKTKKRKSKNAK